MTNLNEQLNQTFGFETFREGQKPVIENLLAGNSSLAIFPTGSGKSLCYQFTATQLPNLTLVVSPLLALMKDQLAFLKKHNIPAASLDSTLSYEEYSHVVSSVRNNTLKILMVSVERFKNERFRMLMKDIQISLLVVDEAHCISEWGHNFRPDYLKLPNYQKEFNISQVLLLTATATKKVKYDMAKKFNLTKTSIVQTGFYRSNLHLHVLSVEENTKIDALEKLIHSHGKVSSTPQCGIVYVTLQKTAEQVATMLRDKGIHASTYHAGMEDTVRKQTQEAFMAGEIPVVVATIAFGMGVDKSNIRFVIHYDLPKSIENYSQEIGRAGRDGHESHCYVLGNLSALNTIENFVYGDTPERSGIESVVRSIKDRPGEDWETKIFTLSNQSNIRQLTLKTLLVKLEMMGAIVPKFSYSDEVKIKLLVDKRTIINAFESERRSFVQALFDSIEFKKIWGEVDFDALYHTYGGERKRAITALEYMRDKHWLEIKTAGNVDVYSVDDKCLEQESLVDNLYQQFKLHEESEIKRIDFLIRFLQSNHCLSNGLARYFDDLEAPERCGHCSVCLGNPVRLSGENTHFPVSPNSLVEVANSLKAFLSKNAEQNCSIVLIARFLVGINVPLFTASKVKKHVNGFGIAEMMRFQDVINVLERELSK